MTISVNLNKRLGSFALNASFASSGRLTALFGQSGSGKTSLVNLIAGLTKPDHGRITVGDRVLVDTEKRIFRPAHKRRIGYVFQDARLFPHLTVSHNLRYGRWFAPQGERYADMDSVVELLGIGHLLGRRPDGLSGGEKQRVAIGRALIASPRLMLMDEPLAALDDARKAEILPYIERLRDETKIPIIYVSHSVAEVARLANDVVILSDGRVLSHGSAADVLARHDLLPASEKGEAGALIELVVAEQEPAYGLTFLRSAGGEWRLPRIKAATGSKVRVRVRARDVMLATEKPAGISALNVLEGVVTGIETGEGPDVLVTLACGDDRLFSRITRRSLEAMALRNGQHLYLVIKAVSFEGGAVAFRHAAAVD
ncbi:molybdenum ABC transporter ATP-binding protein [Tianweitania sp. BSSL-BM11]|uniref:Molybdenum ABC transporter ATP-binding protein n=1 Tax=Tianweitania aestuarii TaxID=2814886 RepID=A0ABS5RW40_9HYPH|nr:molybdenum ABC transporter ATP-binding protein [Tianweitania aestuarii]MBS9721283.1 molybdenum ABC transporter ATP-binding protein [Tianweitania aestuarii]